MFLQRILSQAQKDKMAEELKREVQLEEVDDLGKTFLAAKIKELQEECLEIRKNTSGKYKLYHCQTFLLSSIKILSRSFSIFLHNNDVESNQTGVNYHQSILNVSRITLSVICLNINYHG